MNSKAKLRLDVEDTSGSWDEAGERTTDEIDFLQAEVKCSTRFRSEFENACTFLRPVEHFSVSADMHREDS